MYKINQGNIIKCLFKTGHIIEGIVQEFTDKYAVIKNTAGEIIIFDPSWDNICFFKIIDAKPIDNKPINQVIKKIVEEADPSELDVKGSSLDLRAKKLAELRILQLKEHKENINKVIFEPTISGKLVNYGTPFKYTTKKDSR